MQDLIHRNRRNGPLHPSRSAAVLILALCCAIFSAGGAPASPPQDDALFDLRIGVEEGEPFLVDVVRKEKLDLQVKPEGGKTEKRSVKSEAKIRCVDEFGYFDEGGDLEATRRFLFCHAAVNGKVTDTEMTGITLDYAREGHDLTVTVDGGRPIRKELVEHARKETTSLGLRLPLPAEVRRGVPFTVDFSKEAPFLFGIQGVIYEASGELTLLTVSPASGAARLEGTLQLLSESKEEGFSLERSLACKIGIDLDVRTKRVVAISLRGSGTVQGSGEFSKVTGKDRIDVTVKGAGPEEARKELEKAPRFRAVPRFLEDCCLAFTLPSHWFTASTEGEVLLESSLNTSSAFHRIRIAPVRLEMATFAESAAAAEEELRAEAGKVKRKNVSCPLGRGQSFTFSTAAGMALVEHYPLGHDHLVRIRLDGTKSRFEAALKEYTRARKSLKFVID